MEQRREERVINEANLAPRTGKRKRLRSLSDTGQEMSSDSEDESLLIKILSKTADSAKSLVTTQPKKGDSLLSDIALELADEDATGPAINQDLATMLNKRWSEKLSDTKLTERLDHIQRLENCGSLIVPRVNPEIW